MASIPKKLHDQNNVPSTQDIHQLMKRKLNSNPLEGDKKLKYQLRQCFAALGAILGAILAGMTSAYSAVIIPQLETLASNEGLTSEGFSASNSSVVAQFFESLPKITIRTTSQVSWLGSSGAIFLVPGSWISGIMIEKLGRRMIHLVTTPIYFIAWVTVAFSSSYYVLIIGRLLCGFCMGLLAPACPVYIGETTNPRLRGIILGCISVAASIGNLLAHATGTWFHWRASSLFCGSFCILCFITCSFSPESPTWFLKKGKIEQSIDAWEFLRGKENVKEFEELKNAHAPKFAQDTTVEEKMSGKWNKAFKSKAFLKPLRIVCLVFFTAQCCGVNAITFYSISIFENVSGPRGKFRWTLILDVLRVLVCAITCWLIKRHSNRGLILASGVGTAIVLVSLSIVQFFEVGKLWSPVVLLFLYSVTAFVGLIPLSWMLCGELFPMRYRGLGTGLTSAFGFLCLFGVVLTAPYMFRYLLPWGTFLVYGCIAAVGTFFMYCYLPETRGRTLLEIERLYEIGSNREMKKEGVNDLI